MADVYLGTSTSGSGLVKLPPIRWTGGGDPGIPADYGKRIDRAEMLNGGQRFNFREKHPKRWAFEWQMLTAAELGGLKDLNDELSALWFQNNWEDATWREVVIAEFEYTPVLRVGPTGCRFHLRMTLEEVKV